MVNENLYLDNPYVPHRDPREINAVERLKKANTVSTPVVNDEEVQYEEMERAVSAMSAHLEEKVGAPGGLVPLNEEGKIDSIYLSDYAPSAAAMYVARTSEAFPEVGDSHLLYLAEEENEGNGYIYRWCGIDHCYKRPDDSLNDVSEVYGGSANSF